MKSSKAEPAKQPRGQPFQPGNKFGRGRPKGSRNKVSVQAREILEKNSVRLVNKWIALALKGDLTALKWCVERILPPPRETGIRFKMPRLEQMQDLDRAQSRVLGQVGNGKMTPSDAKNINAVLQDRRDNIEGRELDSKLVQLNERSLQMQAGSRRRR